MNRPDGIGRVLAPVNSKVETPLPECVIQLARIEQPEPRDNVVIDVRDVVTNISDDRFFRRLQAELAGHCECRAEKHYRNREKTDGQDHRTPLGQSRNGLKYQRRAQEDHAQRLESSLKG